MFELSLDRIFQCSPWVERLSPTWQVVYYEGSRGHHILFRGEDVVSLEEKMAKMSKEWFKPKRAEELFVKLFSCPTFRDSVNWIDGLKAEDKAHVFLLYKRLLENWKNQAKQSCH